MLRQVTLEMTSHLEAPTFSLNGATRLLCRIVDESVRFSENSAYLENEPTLYGEWRTSVGLELTALKTLALLASPIMPNFSKVILESLGVNTLWDSQAALIEGDRPIGRFANRNFSQSLSAIETLERELSTKRI